MSDPRDKAAKVVCTVHRGDHPNCDVIATATDQKGNEHVLVAKVIPHAQARPIIQAQAHILVTTSVTVGSPTIGSPTLGVAVQAATPERSVDPKCEPPRSAEFIAAMLVKPEIRQCILGSWAEEFGRNVERFGSRRAALILYYWDIALSLWPLLWACVKRVGVISALVELYRKFRGS